MAVISQMC